ncbi:hypothetical protein GF336_01700 [Candidatus Woesearchaeota archaeon]|nr:hypothetical protein [Candidatus Woesearchaeota archaeon]
MASPSKEEKILELILENSPLRRWHFNEFVEKTGITKAAVNKWLKRYQKKGIIKKIKEKGQFPYYTAGKDNPSYKSKKRLYALEKLYQSGLIEELTKLKKAKTIIIFGSIIKGDWYKGSDIDIFIYGNPEKIKKYKYEKILKKDIELHIFDSRQNIEKVKTGLIKNIIDGHIVKGSIQDFAKVS